MPYVIKDRVHFLSEASKILSDSLNYNLTLANIAKLIVASFADFCIIDVMEKGQMKRVSVLVSDPKEQKLADKFYSFTPDPKNKRAIYDAAKSRKPIIIKKVTKGWIKRVSQIPEERQTVQDLQMQSLIFAPMLSRKKVIGVLTFASTNPALSYHQEDGELADELANRAGIAVDKSKLYTQAQEAIKSRDLFISLASHELKTPITTIYIYLQLLQRNLNKNKNLDPKWLETLMSEMVRLTKIVDEMLLLSQIKTGKLSYSFQETDIKDVAKRAITNFRANHPNHKLIFDDKELSKKNPTVVGDFDKLIQVLINLLDNAAKHSPGSKPITLSLKSDKTGTIISVRDMGKGIGKNELKHIFSEFYKAENNTKPGMGLGLYLTNKIVKAHNGKIKVSSGVGKGTQFVITLPLIEKS